MEVTQRVNALEVKVGKIEAHQDDSIEAVKELTLEVKALRQELTKGKGIAIGIFMVIGAAWGLIWKAWNG